MITGEYKCQHLGLPEVKKMIFLLNFVIQPRIFEICALVMYACSQYMLQASINLRRLTKSVPLAWAPLLYLEVGGQGRVQLLRVGRLWFPPPNLGMYFEIHVPSPALPSA